MTASVTALGITRKLPGAKRRTTKLSCPLGAAAKRMECSSSASDSVDGMLFSSMVSSVASRAPNGADMS
jgi:hypothetical protein